MTLDDLLTRLGALPEEKQEEITQQALAMVGDRRWIPNPGPQTAAFFTQADELFYGGQAGGGKTDLMLGLSVSGDHLRSLILRRTNKEAEKLPIRLQEILGTKDGWSSRTTTWTLSDGVTVEMNGCQLEDDKQKHKGFPHDLIGWDEVSDFSETQFRFINTWNRSAHPGQRCRVVAAGNPPTRAEGFWVIKYWGPWLDPTHPNPAKDGELRWFTTINGIDKEVDGPGPHVIEGEAEPVRARSRTFIRAKLKDNPTLHASGYDSVLAALPGVLRDAYRDGKFDAGMGDADWQVIPIAWVLAAQERWTDKPPIGLAMTAMGYDPAGGGSDAAELAFRYAGWYGPLVTKKGEETIDASSMAALVMKHRKDQAPVVVDVGGGYGGAISLRFDDNGVAYTRFNGANQTAAKTIDGSLGFYNKRAEAWWRMREALDPDQEGGSPIALPPDPELRADLTAPTWTLKTQGILIESKDDLRKRLGRSPGKGDAVVMALSEGTTARKRMMSGNGGRAPVVTMGHATAKSKYRR